MSIVQLLAPGARLKHGPEEEPLPAVGQASWPPCLANRGCQAPLLSRSAFCSALAGNALFGGGLRRRRMGVVVVHLVWIS